MPHRTVNPWLKYWKANREDAASAAKSFEEKTRQVRLMAFISTVHLVFYMSIMIVDFSEGNGISTGVVAGLGVLTMIMILLSLISMCGHDAAAWLNYIRLAMVSEIVIITFHARLAYASFQHKVPDYSEPFIFIAFGDHVGNHGRQRNSYARHPSVPSGLNIHLPDDEYFGALRWFV